MKPVRLVESAEAEALAVFEFYSERSPGLGAEFSDEMERVLALLGSYPEIGPPSQEDLRRVVLRRFPYYLLYRIEEDRILVLVVAHQSREPGYWQSPP